MSKPDGGSAFPAETVDSIGAHTKHPGMSLRDYFAAKALVIFSGSELVTPIRKQSEGADMTIHEGMARIAYAIADAMLAERDK